MTYKHFIEGENRKPGGAEINVWPAIFGISNSLSKMERILSLTKE